MITGVHCHIMNIILCGKKHCDSSFDIVIASYLPVNYIIEPFYKVFSKPIIADQSDAIDRSLNGCVSTALLKMLTVFIHQCLKLLLAPITS